MTAEEIAFWQKIAEEARQVLTVVGSAVVAGIFTLLASKRSTRLEIAKIRAEQEFAAGSKQYDFLKEQYDRVRDGYAALARSMDEILGAYMKLLGQKEAILLQSEGDEQVPKMLDRFLGPLLQTHSFALRSEVKSLRRERDNLLDYYAKHRSSEKSTINELRAIEFSSDVELDDISFEGVRANTFKLKDIALLLSSATTSVLQYDMDSYLKKFRTDE